MSLEKANKLRVVILSGSGKMIVTPLIEQGVNVVGLSEVYDEFGNMGRLKQGLEKIFWSLIKRCSNPYLSWYARKQEISYFEKNKSSTTDYIKWLKNLNPDLLILHLGPVIPADIFKIPRLGTINIHPSLLPKYRGSNPYFWLYYNFDMNAGITLHFIDDSVDTGNIIGQGSYQIECGTPASEVGSNLVSNYAVPLLLNAIQELENTGELDSIPQQSASPTPYARRVTNKEYFELLDFECWSIEHLWHVLHSNEQWRSVFLPKIKDSEKYDWTLDYFKKMKVNAPYGSIYKDAQGFYIAHCEGGIYLKKQYSAKRFIKNIINHFK